MTWKPGLPGFENHQEQCGWCNAGVTNGGQEVFCQPPGRWWSHGTKPWGADGEEVGIPALASRTGLKDRIFGFHVGCAQTHLTSCTKSYTWSKETYACQHWFSVQIIAGIASFRRLQDVNFARHGILYLYVCHLYCRTHHCFQSSMLLAPMEIPWKSLRFPTANGLTQTQLCVAQAPSQLFAALVEPDVVPWGHELVTASPATHRPIQCGAPKIAFSWWT